MAIDLNIYENYWNATTKLIAHKLGISISDLAEKRSQAPEEKISILECYRDQITPEDAADLWIKDSGFIKPWGIHEIAWAMSENKVQLSQLLMSVSPEQLTVTDEFREIWVVARDAVTKLKGYLEPELEKIYKETWGDRFIFPCTCGKTRVGGTGSYMITGEDECCVHGFGDVVKTPEELEAVFEQYLSITAKESDAKYQELVEADAPREDYNNIPLGFHSIASANFAAFVKRIDDDVYEVTEKLVPSSHRNEYKRPLRKFTKSRLFKRYFPE